MTTTCSLIVERAFIFSLFSFLRDFFLSAEQYVSIQCNKKETADLLYFSHNSLTSCAKN